MPTPVFGLVLREEWLEVFCVIADEYWVVENVTQNGADKLAEDD